MILTLALLSCTSEPAVTVTDEPYIWQGWVYGDLPADDSPGLDIGTVRLWGMDGTLIAEGAQLDDDRPSVWTLEIEAASEVEVRLSGPEHVTTVWRSTTPTAQSFWYSGSLFAAKTETMDAFWLDLSDMMGTALSPADGATLLGEPLMVWPNDEAAWTDASVTVYDGNGTVHPALLLSYDDDGLLIPAELADGPIAAFAATNLAPGPTRLVIDSSDGRSAVIDYNAGPGELLSAFAFVLPEPQ